MRRRAALSPIDLNPEQERAVQQWAASESRLWTTPAVTEFNLRVFARVILAARQRSHDEQHQR
jgi:hypothetical protein